MEERRDGREKLRRKLEVNITGMGGGCEKLAAEQLVSSVLLMDIIMYFILEK